MTHLTRPVSDCLCRGSTAMAALSFLCLATPTVAAEAGWAYDVDILVSDGSVPADFTDPHLKNPWGVAFNPFGFDWVANNHTGTSTLYDGRGKANALVVTIPGVNGEEVGEPTGIVFSGGTDFVVSDGTKKGPRASCSRRWNDQCLRLRNGKFLDELRRVDGKAVQIDGLWGIAFGNGLLNQPTNTLFFAAGVNDEEGGAYGAIRRHAAE